MERLTEYMKLEGNKELLDMLRFLIQDQAFHPEFIVTLLLEYYHNSEKEKTDG